MKSWTAGVGLMRRLTSKQHRITKGSVCGIGSFDGVHRGHQEIVRYLKKIAGSKRKIGIVTFIPLPFFVLTSAPIMYLTLKEEKEKIFGELDVDFIYYFKFTSRLSQLEPHDFVRMIAGRISPDAVVVGENFHFGKGRRGSARLLKQLSNNKFLVHILPRVEDEGTISSTRIRELLLLGNIRAANKLLGRQYSISGEVIKGKGRGTKLGFPTINIKTARKKLLPLEGVYKVNVLVRNKRFLGAMFCKHDAPEVHILNFSGTLYKARVTVELRERIRDIERFPDDKALQAAISRDVEVVRNN